MELRHRRVIKAMLLTALVGAAGGSSTWATFKVTSANTANRVTAGTVDITDNDGGSTPMLAFASALPGKSDMACIKVTYSGSLDSRVRMHGTTTGSGLDQYLDLKVTRGAYTGPDPAFASCTGFQADSTDYTGAGGGVVYDGTLRAFPDDYANGLVDPRPSSPETWSTGESHVYKVQVTLQNDLAAQGKDATQTFTWEARNQ